MDIQRKANDLDSIIKSVSHSTRIFSKVTTTEQEHEYYKGLALILKTREFANVLTIVDNHIELMILDKGIAFVQQGGFVSESEELQREIRKDQLTKKQINAAKREPYLIAWSVISTISTITLAILRFLKP